MSAWTWLVLILAVLLLPWLVLRVWGWVAGRRRSAAGIQTGGRGLLLGRMLGRNAIRRAALRVRMIFATRARKKELAERSQIKSAQEAAAVLGNMKGVFMKLGQIVSFAHDALPEQAKGALQGLQKDAPAMSFDLVRGVLEAELGGDLSTRFRDVEERALASASIGQVHRAWLRDGTAVVVKVQYPGVDTAIEGDLAALGRMGAVIGAVNPALDVPSVLAELRERIVDELDYRKEARSP